MVRSVFMKTLSIAVCLLLTVAAESATYYVDPSSTSSTANGSLATPWKTLAQVQSNMSLFQPGDFILFKRGQKFSGTLTISRSGAAGRPITFGAYGTGADPHFWGTGSSITWLFYLNNRSYITFYGLNITDTTISETDRTIQSKIERAFYIDGSSNIVIRKIKMDRVGVGAYMTGPNNTMDSCDIGNMRMVRNTPTSVNPDDDYGANPVVISSAGNRITYNYFHDCWATSFDYGLDGGAVEFFGDGASDNFIGYNRFYDCNGVAENGSSSGGTIANNVFAYNLMINNASTTYIHNSGNWGVNVTNFQFLNNVIVESGPWRDVSSSPALFKFKSTPTVPGTLILKNNIIWLYGTVDVGRSGQLNTVAVTHEDNIYRLGSGSVLDFTMNPSELVTSSPIWMSTTGEALNWDYRPATNSPAVDFGQTVGLSVDFVGNSVPAANNPDAGIIEAVPSGGLQATATAGTIACNGGSTTVTVSATGGTAPYTGTGSFTVTAGSYTYTVRDAANRTANATITVSQPTALSATVATGTITVNGGTTTATVTATGGTGSRSFSLNGGTYQTSNVFNNVPAGNHSVTVRDANNCTTTRNFSVTQPAAFSASATAGTIACNGGTATVTVTASGGVSPYSGTGTFSVAAGTHSYTVTDANGATATTSVTVSQPAAISVTLSTGTILVNGGTTTITVSATGGTGTRSFRLNNGAFQSGNVFNNVPAGTHTITVRDANNCTATRSAVITEPAVLTASSSAGTIACNGGSAVVTVSATGGVSPYSGTGSFNVLAGTYTYTVTDANGATASTSVTVSQPAVVNATINAGTINVNGGSTSVTVNAYGGTPSYSYQLNNGAYQASNVFNNVPAGNHVVTIRDANNCTAVKNVAISQPTVLTANASAANVACNGGSTTVTVSAAGGTAPYTGTGTFSVSAGTYSYTVTDAAGSSATTSITVTQPSAISIAVSTGTITVFGGTTTVQVSAGGGAGSGYEYRLNNGTFQSSNTFSNVPAGNHTVTVRDGNGCTSSRTFTITQPANNPVVVNASATNILCNGGSSTVTVTATGGTAPYIGTGTFTVTAGTYTYTVRDVNGLSASTTITITQPSVLTAAVSAGTITVNGGTTTATVTAAGGTAPYSYRLNAGSFQSANVITGVPAGTHTITVQDANGCSVTRSISLTEPTAINVTITQGTAILCNGGTTTVTVSATGGTAPYTGTGTFTVAAGTHQYTVRDAAGATTTRSITVSQPAALDLVVSTEAMGIGETTTTATIDVTGGTAPYSYSIDGSAFQSSNVFAGIGVGDHMATVLDANGCTRTENFGVALSLAQNLSINLVSKTNVSCRGGNDGIIEVLATGGGAPYTYSINNGRFTNSNLFKNLPAGTYRVTVKDGQSNSNSLVVTVFDGRRRCNDVGLSGRVTLSAFPNPTVDRFTLTIDSEVEDDVTIEVFNAEGKPVHQDRGAFDKRYQFGENFKAGTYIIRVRQAGKVETIKVIKGR